MLNEEQKQQNKKVVLAGAQLTSALKDQAKRELLRIELACSKVEQSVVSYLWLAGEYI